MPIWLLVVLVVIVLAVLLVVVITMNDIRRYLRIRKM